MGLAIQLIGLLNAAEPGIANLLLLIKRKDGTVSIIATLDEADAKFAANIAEAKAWLQSH